MLYRSYQINFWRYQQDYRKLKEDNSKKERASWLFQTAVMIERNFKSARDALKELQTADMTALNDWVSWWFNPTTHLLIGPHHGFSLDDT